MKSYIVRTYRVAAFLIGSLVLAIASVGAPAPLTKQTGQPTLRATLEGRIGIVASVAYSPDGKTLASGSTDTTIELWDLPVAKQAKK